MIKHALGGLVTVALISLGACGPSDDPEPKSSSSSTPSSKEDLLAGVITNNPKDLTWKLGPQPSSWKKLKTEEGDAQWQVSPRCVLSTFQPAGLLSKGKDAAPSQEEVLDEYVSRLGASLKASISTDQRSSRRFPVDSNVDGTLTVKASSARLNAAGGLEGMIYAYRGGDFALVLMTFCGDNTFSAVDKAKFEPYIADKVAINATY